MSDRREEIAKKYVPCRCDEAYTSRGLTAPDCPFHSADPEMAMDEYFTERALELLEYLAKNNVVCESWEQDDDGEIHCSFRFNRDWISKEQLFENFL